MNKEVTIKDIAKRLTISRDVLLALQGSKKVNERTKELIFQDCQGYGIYPQYFSAEFSDRNEILYVSLSRI